jgi:hypothetical protein
MKIFPYYPTLVAEKEKRNNETTNFTSILARYGLAPHAFD